MLLFLRLHSNKGVGVHYNNNNFVKLMSSCELELLCSSAKKIYEFILSAKEASELLRQALNYLIKQSINSPEHFPFLLYRINWFESPFTHFHPQFLKIFSSKVFLAPLPTSKPSNASAASSLKSQAKSQSSQPWRKTIRTSYVSCRYTNSTYATWLSSAKASEPTEQISSKSSSRT